MARKAIADEFVREGATVLYSSYESRPLEDAVDAISKQEVEGRSPGDLAAEERLAATGEADTVGGYTR